MKAVMVRRVRVPAMSTIGFAEGQLRESDGRFGRAVQVVGDHRPMRYLGEALVENGKPLVIEVDDFDIF